MLRDLERVVTNVPITEDVWKYAIALAQRCRMGGLTVPTTDLVIFSASQSSGRPVLHNDKHSDAMAALTD